MKNWCPYIYTNNPNTKKKKKKSSLSLDNSTTGMHFLEESTGVFLLKVNF